MRANPAAVYGVNKISPFLHALFEKTQRVSLGLIGDSTVVYGAWGWDSGIRQALEDLGILPYGGGLHGCGEVSGVGFDTFSSPNPQNGAYSGLPSEWQSLARNKSSDSGYLGCLEPWFITANQAPGNSGLYVARYASFIREAMKLRMWYARTTATTAGSSIKVHVRKQQSSSGTNYVELVNFDPSVANTFKLVVGGIATASITVSTNATTMANNIKTAVDTLTGRSVSVSATVSYLGYIYFTVTIAAPDLTITVDTTGMTAKYAGKSVVWRVTRTLASAANYSTIGSEATIDSDQAAANDIAMYERDLVADAARDFDTGLMVNYSTTGVAPFLALWYAASAPGRRTGFDITPLVSIGANPTRVHATRLQNQTDAYLSGFFSAWAANAEAASVSDHKRLMVIHDGLNDQNDSTSSVGPSPAASNTRAGCFDNLKAVANRLDAIHALNGWSTRNLSYAVIMPQPQQSDDSNLTPYRQAVIDFVNWHPRAAAVNLAQLHDGFSTDVTQLAGWTGSASDFSHPHAEGFRVWAKYAFESLREANRSHGGLSRRQRRTRISLETRRIA